MRDEASEPQRDPIHPEPTHAGAGRYAGIGLQFAAAIAVFLFLGMWLDARLGTEPWLLIAGVAVGGGGGFYSIYRKLMADQRADDARRQRQREGR